MLNSLKFKGSITHIKKCLRINQNISFSSLDLPKNYHTMIPLPLQGFPIILDFINFLLTFLILW